MLTDIALIILVALLGNLVFSKLGVPGILGMVAAGVVPPCVVNTNGKNSGFSRYTESFLYTVSLLYTVKILWKLLFFTPRKDVKSLMSL